MLRGLAMPVQVGGKPPKKTKWGQWAIAGGIVGLMAIGAIYEGFKPEPEASSPPSMPSEEAAIIAGTYYRDNPPQGWRFDGATPSTGRVIVGFVVPHAVMTEIQRVNLRDGGSFCSTAVMAAIAPSDLWLLVQRPDGSDSRLLRCE